MIERQRKITLVLQQSERTRVLTALQELGLCHVESRHIPETPALRDLRSHIALMEGQLRTLKDYGKRYTNKLPQKTWRVDVAEVSESLSRLAREREALLLRQTTLRLQIAQWEPFGNLDPEWQEKLEKHKVRLAFCTASKVNFSRLDPAGLAMAVLSEDKATVNWVVFVPRRQKLGEKEKAVLANQIELPRLSLASLEAELDEVCDELDEIERQYVDHTRYTNLLELAITLDRDTLALELARSSVQPVGDSPLAVLVLWVSERDLARVEAELSELPLVWLNEAPNHDDVVPVKLRQNPVARLFQPILALFSLPSYHEIDPTPFFAPFYTLFFGLCLADVGYGLIMVAVCLIALIRLKSAEARRYVLLGLLLGSAVIVGGILVDDYFGERIATEYDLEQAHAVMNDGDSSHGVTAAGSMISNLGKVVAPLAWLKKRDDAMTFPMMLGVIQVLLGWALRIVNQTRHHGWQGIGQPLGNMFVMVGLLLMALPTMLPANFTIGPFGVVQWAILAGGAGTGQVLLIAGLALVLLFNGVEKGRKIWIRPVAGLWSLYELGSGMISDILSYLRLFALGLAGSLLAEAINNIARGLIVGNPGFEAYIGMVLILLVGHALNFGLGMLSAFVHSLRLQFVEFYKAIEFKGGGLPFTPFATHRMVPAGHHSRPGKA